jgi:hypothetical protein
VARQLLFSCAGRGEDWRVKPDLCITEKSHVVYEILTYLAEHPDSSDSLEGIAQWWLLERSIEHHIGIVKEALAELVVKGLVLENKGRDERTHYRINRRKQREIQALLKQRSDDMRFG